MKKRKNRQQMIKWTTNGKMVRPKTKHINNSIKNVSGLNK